MKPQELALLSFNPSTLPPSTFLSRRDSLQSLFKRRPMPTPSSIRSLYDRDHRRAPIGCSQPPWSIHPPAAPENPFSACCRLPDPPVKSTGTGIPFSLRLVQMKKRLARDFSTLPQSSSLESASAGKAVSALAFTIGELQSTVFVRRTVGEEVLDKVSSDRTRSFELLFRRVFFSSPNLVVQLLVLISGYLISSTADSISLAETPSSPTSEDDIKGFKPATEFVEDDAGGADPNSLGSRAWTDVTIEEEDDDEDGSVDRRRRSMYERSIATGIVNSLILSNYAQFLYRVANDHDRADQYFRWAVVSEPRDAEAMSRYALFLWEERGDIDAAEEMFIEAIEADPGNHYHCSNYARFLFQTGASDTCYPLNPLSPQQL